MSENENTGKLKSRYSKYIADRQPFLDRARDCSKLTIPTLIPPDGETKSTKFATPLQSLGARGVKNLASKLILTLLPPNAPFFKLQPDPIEVKKQLEQNPAFKTEIMTALAEVERITVEDIETTPLRVKLFEFLKHLLVGGNCLLYLNPKGIPKVYHFDKYVIKRDPMGQIIEIITKESTVPQALSAAILAQVVAKSELKLEDTEGTLKTIDIYTQIKLDSERTQWTVSQEINGVPIDDAKGTYPLDECPWIAPRLYAVDGEDYGRSYVEEYLGDLISLEALSRAIVEGSVAAAKVLFFVKPNGTTKMSVVANAANGKVVSGDSAEVTTLQLNKFADFKIALEMITSLNERLSYAFLLNSAVQRNAERVTAEEIRYMASELEDALGGVYSILTQELQLPLVRVKLKQLQKQGKLPALPKDIVKPTITTGLEALGREHDLKKTVTFIQQLAVLGEEAIATYLNVPDYIQRVATGLCIDTKGLIKSETQVQEEQAAKQAALQKQELMQTMMNKAPDLMNAASNMKEKGTEMPADMADQVQGAMSP